MQSINSPPSHASQPAAVAAGTRLILVPLGGLDRFCAVFARDQSRPRAEANFGGIVWRKMPSRDLQYATYVGECESADKTVSPEICIAAMEVVEAFPVATLVLLGFTNPQGYQLPVRTLTCTSLPFLLEAGYIGPPRPNTSRAQSALRIFLNPHEAMESEAAVIPTRATPSPAAHPRDAPGAPRAPRHRRPLPGARALDFDAAENRGNEDEEEEEEEEEEQRGVREVFIDVAAEDGAQAIRQALAHQIMREALAARLMQQQQEDPRLRRGRREQREARARPYMHPQPPPPPPPHAMVLQTEDGRVIEFIFGDGGGAARRRPRDPSPPRESDADKRRRLLAELERTEEGEAETFCAVCYEEYATPENNTDDSEVVAKLNIAGCTHSVCPACYQGMLLSGRSVRCPTCRHPIQEIYPDGCIDCLINAGTISPANVRVSPCEHKCLCLGCAKQRARDLSTDCPVCASDYSSCRAN